MGFLQRLFGGSQREREKADGKQDAPEGQVAVAELVEADTEPDFLPIRGEGQTRPLPPLDETRVASKRLRYGQSTDGGMVRDNNQDALLTMSGVIESADSPPPFGIFIVADGMGGHSEGERASMVAAKTLARIVTTRVYMPMLDAQEGDRGSDQPTVPEVLEEAMLEADQAVKQSVPEGGTTLTAAVIYGNLLYIGHVGDSRAYLINDGNMELITRDHSLARRLQEIGHLTPEEAEAYPQKNVLYKALGQGDVLDDVDRATRRLLPGAQLLLCSDGLWGVVEDETILRIIQDAPGIQAACDRLVATANQAGGPDNITAVLVEIPA